MFNDKDMSIIACLSLIIGLTFGSLITNSVTRKIERDAAIQANVAEYVVDSKTGRVDFHYIECPKLETDKLIPIPSFENEPNFQRFDSSRDKARRAIWSNPQRL